MEPEITRTLLGLNRVFYQTFASEFHDTRQRLQPGVQAVLKPIPRGASILDLGCGNGQLWRTLSKRGHQGSYVGLDFSPELLEFARQYAAGRPGQTLFLQADLAVPGWEEEALLGLPIDTTVPPEKLAGEGPLFDYILAFAVLHHLPGGSLRNFVIQSVRRLLASRGKFIHSNWQVHNSARLVERIQPWERIGLHPEDVDPGDILMDWRRGGEGLRYVHEFGEAELISLAAENGFTVTQSFYSDGQGGNLGLYQVWEIREDQAESTEKSIIP
jgi:SAM-dependent methyltransferase